MRQAISRKAPEYVTLSTINQDMPFPDSERTIYGRNPLDEVICQLRFPPVLKIDSELPTAFQEAIRNEYPLYKEQRVSVQAGAMPEQLSQVFASLIPQNAGKAYEFAASDERWKITLSRDFLALTCMRYERWEDFNRHFEPSVNVLVEQYKPAFYSRIGLRYRDVIVRSSLGLTDVAWSDLLQPHIAGVLGSTVATSIEEITHQLTMKQQKHDGKLTLQHGTAKLRDSSEECYYIDADFFKDTKTPIGEAQSILNYFNRQSGKLFRWCITDRLHNAMEPAAVA
ncbi:MAG TPA: TIGR04255 family protein [Candidatus Angelobacter sp.]|jgi:uncharacterized protein (TIGR04255 family)